MRHGVVLNSLRCSDMHACAITVCYGVLRLNFVFMCARTYANDASFHNLDSNRHCDMHLNCRHIHGSIELLPAVSCTHSGCVKNDGNHSVANYCESRLCCRGASQALAAGSKPIVEVVDRT